MLMHCVCTSKHSLPRGEEICFGVQNAFGKDKLKTSTSKLNWIEAINLTKILQQTGKLCFGVPKLSARPSRHVIVRDHFNQLEQLAWNHTKGVIFSLHCTKSKQTKFSWQLFQQVKATLFETNSYLL